MPEQPFLVERHGVRLAGIDFSGDGPAVLLLHGLAGHAVEWRETAEWLTHRHRVIAYDARGHGRSERFPRDISLSAHAADAVSVLERHGIKSVIAIGQSFGGLMALTLASSRPDLVHALVMVESSPDGGGSEQEIEDHVGHVEAWLRSWPTPFQSRAQAVDFFGGPSLLADAWTDGLTEDDDGLHASFDIAVMARTLRDASRRAYWERWDALRCPVLVVTAGVGHIPAEHGEQLAGRIPDGRHTAIASAKHDLHLDQPDQWRTTLQAFLDQL